MFAYLITITMSLFIVLNFSSAGYAMGRQADALNNPDLSCAKKCLISDKEATTVQTIDKTTLGERGECFQICFDCQQWLQEPGLGPKHPKYKEKWDAYDDSLRACTQKGRAHIVTPPNRPKTGPHLTGVKANAQKCPQTVMYDELIQLEQGRSVQTNNGTLKLASKGRLPNTQNSPNNRFKAILKSEDLLNAQSYSCVYDLKDASNRNIRNSYLKKDITLTMAFTENPIG